MSTTFQETDHYVGFDDGCVHNEDMHNMGIASIVDETKHGLQ